MEYICDVCIDPKQSKIKNGKILAALILKILFCLLIACLLLLQNYDALIVRSDTKITSAVLSATNSRVKVVGRYGYLTNLFILINDKNKNQTFFLTLN